MNHLANIYIWDTLIGAVSMHDGEKAARFEYDRDFIALGIEVAPAMMPCLLAILGRMKRSLSDCARKIF